MDHVTQIVRGTFEAFLLTLPPFLGLWQATEDSKKLEAKPESHGSSLVIKTNGVSWDMAPFDCVVNDEFNLNLSNFIAHLRPLANGPLRGQWPCAKTFCRLFKFWHYILSWRGVKHEDYIISRQQINHVWYLLCPRFPCSSLVGTWKLMSDGR
jgi:hypothetical protein